MTFNSPIRRPISLFLVVACFFLPCGSGAISAFPGAEGPQAETSGGRGGRVIPVTNLEDAGPGSLRAALEAGGPRIVIFRVGGRIDLEDPIIIRHPRVTIAGQTAPGIPVCLHGAEFSIQAEEVLIRHLTFDGNLDLPPQSGGRHILLDRCAMDCENMHGTGPRQSLIPPVDMDVDGMPDAWERRHGLNWQDPADGADDDDGDGYTNLEEYLNGTTPVKRGAVAPESGLIEAGQIARHVDFFNGMEEERVVNLVPNEEAWDWMRANIPLFECSDAEIEEMYYFRWWALRKHLKRVGEYHAYTEFIELETKAPFIPPERTIASALGHHFMETRWLRDQSNDNSFLDYWIRGKEGRPQKHFHRYSSWLAESLWQRSLVTGDRQFLLDRFPELLADYRNWQSERQREDGLYWQYDVWDAMEESISGSRHDKNVRPTINSYMYGNARALAKLAELAGEAEVAKELEREADQLREMVLGTLWNPEHEFFEVVHEDGSDAGVREAIGFIPWYFHLPETGKGYEAAWEQLTDPEGFRAPWGLTTAEIRHPEFRSHGIGTCEWDGAVWPFATSQTLGALANVIRDYPGAPVSNRDYMEAFVTYSRSQYYDGLPYIGEYLDERTGVWLKGRHPRSYYYHHSTYADLLITDLVGLQPSESEVVVIDPLITGEEWDWFCLDNLNYRGNTLSIFWDREGSRYGKGRGFHLWINGQPAAHSDRLEPLSAPLGK